MQRFLIFLLVLLPPAEALGQYDPYRPANQQPDPRVRRALRERAVAFAGANSRDFVEKYGDDAVAAIYACTQAGAMKLVEFSKSGDLGKLPRPNDLLKVIALPGNGDDVVLWAINHAKELGDVDNFDAFLFSPLEYAYALKALDQGAAEMRARRLSLQAAATPAPQPQQPQLGLSQIPLDNRTLAWVGGGLLVVILIVWWKKRQSSGGVGV